MDGIARASRCLLRDLPALLGPDLRSGIERLPQGAALPGICIKNNLRAPHSMSFR
jgi:hypothetical protein